MSGVGRTWAIALVGVAGHLVEVEAHIGRGLTAFHLVGLPDVSLRESRERVRAAVGSCGLRWSDQRTTVNLSPAALPKTGTGFDLAIAIAVLAAAGLPKRKLAAQRVHIGELGLDGRIHPVRGILPAVAAAVAAGFPQVVVPAACAAEAALVPGAQVQGYAHLGHLVQDYGVTKAEVPASLPIPLPVNRPGSTDETGKPDLQDVRGQDFAIHALTVAAAGGHHLFLVGVPGAGKTMLAHRLPGLLPDLADETALGVTAIHSLAGTFDPAHGLPRRPPFEAPHHTASLPAMVGGGSGTPQPGAISLAHGGVLFLDEAPEFAPRILDALRQPLESGEVRLRRVLASARYPADFQLVLAANPCPCGLNVGKGTRCTCTALAQRRYLQRLSGPLLDRIDLQIEVLAPTRGSLAISKPAPDTATVAAKVAQARQRAVRRWAATPWQRNSQVPGSWLRSADGGFPRSLLRDLDHAAERGLISLRGADRVLRVAWTLADLEERDHPEMEDVTGAMALRTRGGGNHAGLS